MDNYQIMKEILQTNRLILREYTQEDFNDLLSILSDPETMKYYPKPYDEKGCQRWLDWSFNNYKTFGFGLWAVQLKSTGEFLGDCGITMQQINGKTLPELGFHIHKNHHKKGYATEAGKGVLSHIFKTTDFTHIYCYQTKDNLPSRKTAEKLGFTLLEEYVENNVTHTAYRLSREQFLS